MLFILMTQVAWAGCGAPTTPAQIDSTLQEATLAFAAMDEDGFRELALRAEVEIACLSSVLTPTQVATYDRIDGMRLFTEGDLDGARAAFVAARALDPRTELSDRIAPEGGKLARMFAEAKDAPSSTTETVDVAAGNTAWVDGTAGAERPTAVVSVVQVGRSESNVAFSKVLRPREALALPSNLQPPEPVLEDTPAPTVPAAPVAKVERTTKKHSASTPLWVATGVSALAAGGLFAASVYTNLEFAREPSQTTIGINHGTWYGAVGLGGATVVLAGVAVAVSL